MKKLLTHPIDNQSLLLKATRLWFTMTFWVDSKREFTMSKK